MSFFNQFSYIVMSATVLIVAGALLWNARKIPAAMRIGGWLVLLIALGAFWFAARPTDTPEVRTLSDVEARLGRGTPVVLELYSEYCLGCMAQSSAVEALQQALGERAAVLRLSIHTEVGAALWTRYKGETTPTFIIFDGEGREARRTNVVPSVAQVLGQTP
ncbi:MAG: thioredoxin family protein [Anaerolineae bacterium]|nr:thioredoxin family protein [Anaerolineae bacterium]MDW8300306.1 thioredoxin family protein [Anaerolineae bacterium]